MGGVMSVGVVADPGLVPDVSRLARAIEHVIPDHYRALHAPRSATIKPRVHRAA
jgi:hypothetical protein